MIAEILHAYSVRNFRQGKSLRDHELGWSGGGALPGYRGGVGVEVVGAVGRWEDFASFMVPRKPGAGGCVCVVYRNSSLDMGGRIALMRGLCEREPGPGVLAYVDGEVAGWCSIAPKASYRALVNSRTIPHVDDSEAWSAVCFVVRPGFRRRGLMHDLLNGAVEHARAMGATVVEGYPVDPDGSRIDQTSGYVGTVALFEAHGFERVQRTTGRRGGKQRWLVRRELA
jgi:GNAT superfamily N-acetyltransferase